MTQRLSKMMNSNKRKGRMNNPNSNKLGRSKYFSDKNMSCDGIYGNSRVTYTGASLVGCVVQIQVHDGNVYEGVLRTFSHQLDLVLEMAHRVSPKCAPVKGVSQTVSNLISSYPFEGGLHDKIVFKLSDVVMMQACNVDVDYAVKDAFTDTAISKFNGQVKERELEPWEGADSDSEETSSSLALTIEEEDTNGWDANDMFRTNAEKYGVKSSYDNSLQEYTVALTKKDTEEWKQQEAKALKIAQEIETNTSYQSRIQLENGGDEEDRFSAVVRSSSAEDTTTTSSSKYILPQKRRNAPGIKRHTSTAPSSSPVHLSLKPYSASIPGKGKPFTTPDPPPPAPAPPKGAAPPADKSLEESEEAEPVKLPPEPKVAENVPALVSGPPPKMLPPRIERRRENEKKFAKQKGRMDEIEDFKKFSKNFNVLTEEKECVETEEAVLSSQVERMKLEKEEEEEKCANVVKYSTLNPNAKEFVFNPNAKAFTPRSVPAPPPIPVQATPPPQPPPLMAAPSPQMMAPQPLFTAMAPHQYVMQAPVSVAISHHQQPFVQHNSHHHHHHQHHPQQRFRKAASAQSILAPTGLPGPSQLTVQYTTSPPGVLHAQPQPQTAVGYPQMNFVVGPRVVSPQPVGVIPTSHSVSYCDASHLPTHLIMSAHPGASHSAASTPHSIHQGAQQQQQPGHHPPQSQTPVLHPAPSPVHQVPGNHAQPPPVYSHQAHHALAHHHHHHHPGFPPGGPQPVVLMQQPHHHHQASHHHAAALHHHMLHQNPGLLPQMALIPTSTAMTSAAPSSVATPPYVQQHP